MAIRALKAHGPNQVQMGGRPFLSRPRADDSFGIMGTLRMSDWPIDWALVNRTFPTGKLFVCILRAALTYPLGPRWSAMNWYAP